MHLYSALLCIAIHPKCFTIMWGGLSSTTTKVQGLFIRHILNYTGYNQKRNVNEVRSAQWTVQKNKYLNKGNTTQEHIYINIGKKRREIKSKMCNRIKKCKTNKMCKTVYWDLINSNMNRDVHTGCTGYIQVAAIWMMRIVNVLQLIH